MRLSFPLVSALFLGTVATLHADSANAPAGTVWTLTPQRQQGQALGKFSVLDNSIRIVTPNFQRLINVSLTKAVQRNAKSVTYTWVGFNLVKERWMPAQTGTITFDLAAPRETGIDASMSTRQGGRLGAPVLIRFEALEGLGETLEGKVAAPPAAPRATPRVASGLSISCPFAAPNLR